MLVSLAVTSLVVTSLALPSVPTQRLEFETAPRVGEAWQVRLESEVPLPSGAALFATRSGERGRRLLAAAGPDGRFSVEVPRLRTLEGMELDVWAEAATLGGRLRTAPVSLTLAAARPDGFDPSVDRFAITGCSLMCNSGPDISCGIVNTFQNADVAVTFSQPVDLQSVLQNPTAFRFTNNASGVFPSGTFLLDPGDPSTLIFRPALTFGPAGTPSFGFESGASYSITVPGALTSSGPFVLSATGKPVVNRLQCSITTDQGILDYVPGPPVLVLTPADGATEVPLDSQVTFVFQDVMNLGTVVNPSTLTLPFIQITDGLGGPPIAGTSSFSIDVNAKTTTLTFTPSQPLPANADIWVDVPPQVTDLVSNPVQNGGLSSFTTAGS